MSSLIEGFREQQKAYSDKKKKIEYLNVHTAEQEAPLKGAYSYASEQISTFTSDAGKQNDSELELNSTLIHEDGHAENADVYHLEMSPSQIHEVNECDEISQKIRELVYRRNEYLKTGDVNVFNDLNKDFTFYADAVKSGAISPEKSAFDKESFDKEMSFIMNGTMNAWQEKYGEFYKPQMEGCAAEYFCRVGKYAQHNQENQDKAFNQLLTIGGVNFNQYRNQDFSPVSPDVKNWTEIAAGKDEAQIMTKRQELIDKGATVIPSLQADRRDRKDGYLTRKNPRSREELKAESGVNVVTAEEKINNLKKMGVLDGSEDKEFLEMLGCTEDTKIHYNKTPEEREIPDTTSDKFIKQPSKREKIPVMDRIKRMRELHGFGEKKEGLGNGAAQFMNTNIYNKCINQKIYRDDR